ncbi:hypothetical protein PMAYCL1PPCAC_18244, partial [Pristionchus mayeri]
PASQASVDALSAKVDKMMVVQMEILSFLKQNAAAPPPSPALTSLPPVVDVAREVYEAVTKAVSDKAEYEDKECRAVVIGSVEPSEPSKGLEQDQKIVSDLVTYSGSDECKKAFCEGKVKFHRHPSDRPPKSRPLKIAFESKALRDSFLSGIRSKQLQLERDARKEAVKKNLECRQIVYGVRDYSLITYRNPRPLPPNYGTPRGSRDQNPPADDSTPDDASSSAGATSASSSAPAKASRSIPSPSSPNVSLFYANCRSIRCKTQSLSFLLASFTYRVLSFSETWLASSDSDSLLINSYHDYFVFRNDQAITVDLYLTFTNNLPYRKIRIITIYRSPSSPSLSLTSLVNYLSLLANDSFPCIILGDFNLPQVNWLAFSSPTQNDLLSFMADNRFNQYVTFPTRCLSFLDLVFCNYDIIHNVSPSIPLSDHISVNFDLRIPSPPPRHYTPSRMYRLADWHSLNENIFYHDWTIALRDLNANDAYIYFTNFINDLLDSYVPLSRPSELSKYPKNVRILYGKSHNLARIAPNSVASIRMHNRFKSALNRFHCYIESKIVASSNSKSFYQFCSGKLSSPKLTPSAIIDNSGTTLLTNDDKCVAFSQFFSSVFSHPMNCPLPLLTPSLTFDLPTISHLDILSYFINGVLLNEPTVKEKNVTKVIVKDLGVHFSPNLSFSYHIQKIVAKARSKINLMFKSFHSKCPTIYKKAYTTFVLPTLEYCSVIWNPSHSVELTKELGKVQRDFSRRLYSRCVLPHVPYFERMQFLELTTLESRRTVTDIVFLHSILHSRYLLDFSSLLIPAPLTRPLRNGHPLRITLPFIPPKSYSTLVSRSISFWNSLTTDFVVLPHNSFRSLISSQPPLSFP